MQYVTGHSADQTIGQVNLNQMILCKIEQNNYFIQQVVKEKYFTTKNSHHAALCKTGQILTTY